MSIQHPLPARTPTLLVLLLGLALLPACMPRPIAEPFASGLNQPRGMVFDEAGDLLVAEAGTRATPAGGSPFGRVVRIDPRGNLSVLADRMIRRGRHDAAVAAATFAIRTVLPSLPCSLATTGRDALSCRRDEPSNRQRRPRRIF